MEKIKIAALYQVVMHYRLPLYLRMAQDTDLDFTLLYGAGQKNSKQRNCDFPKDIIKSIKHLTIRLPFKTSIHAGTMPIYPNLFFNLIRLAPDVILSEGTSSIMNASIAFIYAKIFRKKFIWWSMGLLRNKKNTGLRKILEYWEIFIERRSDAIFTYSHQGKDYFLSHKVAPENIFVGVNVLDTNKKLEENKKQADKAIHFEYSQYFNLVFIGSVIKVKKLELLIDVLQSFNEKNGPKAKLHIIGDGPYLNNIKAYAAEKNAEKDIIFYGRINEGAGQILKQCDVMVLPGLGGLAICEAMLSALPVITGYADGTELDLVDESCGYIIPDMNHDNLLEKISELYFNPTLRKKMGEQAYARITGQFHFDNYYGQLKNAIRHCLKLESGHP